MGTWCGVHAHGWCVYDSPESPATNLASAHFTTAPPTSAPPTSAPPTSAQLTSPLLAQKADDALLYNSQRDALIGFDDSDRGVSPDAIRTMARRWHVQGVLIDVDETAPSGHAFAYPSLRLLRFHPTALVLWIAAHEITHLAMGLRFPGEPAHGTAFVEHFLTILRVECGTQAVDRLSKALDRHATLRDLDASTSAPRL